jgi:hypothetical protein
MSAPRDSAHQERDSAMGHPRRSREHQCARPGLPAQSNQRAETLMMNPWPLIEMKLAIHEERVRQAELIGAQGGAGGGAARASGATRAPAGRGGRRWPPDDRGGPDAVARGMAVAMISVG